MSAEAVSIEAAAFMALFPGHPGAHATADFGRTRTENGKVVPKYVTHDRPATYADFERHLRGERGLVVNPLDADSCCEWLAIDVDVYGISAVDIAQRMQEVGLRLVAARTKSDGWRLFAFFREPEPADKLQALGKDWSSLLGFADAEVFPKQAKYKAGEKGNGINLPYFNAAATEQYGINDFGERLPLMAWLEHAKSKRTTLHMVRQMLFADGPPCLQTIAARKLREHDGRDNALYQALVYAKMKYAPEELAARADDYNDTLFLDLLSPAEVAKTVESVSTHEYRYKCHDVPCAALCNKALCERREFGVGSQSAPGAVFLPDNQTSILESAAEIYRRASDAQLLYLRGDRVAQVQDDAIELVERHQMRSIIERLGPTYSKQATRRGGYVARRSSVSADQAAALLACDERRSLPEIVLVVDAPLIRDDGEYLQPGYNEGGIFVRGDGTVEEVEYRDAVNGLRGLLADFKFASPADYTRAFAMFITPALRMSGLLEGPVPILLTEADLSQAGKTLIQEITRTIYNARVPINARRRGGVGSYDESLGAQYLAGHPFVVLDNVRGRLDSQYLEAAVTAPSGLISVRIPHKPEITVDISRVTHQINSNGMEMTPDLANRCCISRIRKQPAGYAFQHASIVDHVRERQPYYLGCVFAVIRDWIERGKPQLPHAEGGHDFRVWARAVGEMTRHARLDAHLMEGHEEIKSRASDSARTWLRSVAPLMDPLELYNAKGLYLCASACEIEFPGGAPSDEADAAKKIGLLMSKAFRDSDELRVDEHLIRRRREERQRDDGKGTYSMWLYWREAPTEF